MLVDYSGIAQLVEHLTVNQGVDGSSPPAGVFFYNGELSERPKEHDWKSCKRVITCFKGSNPLLSVCESYKYDPLVKWLRHRPFTAVTWVQIPYGSSMED